jgi:hypothetical protein
MAKKKKQQGGGQQFLSPEKYLRERARTLEIGTCYVTKDIDEAKMGHVIVTRRHTGGHISMAAYLVDMACLGVKDSFYRLRMDDWEFGEFLDDRRATFRECSYEEAHNRVWGSVAWAEEAGIKPDKTFSLTQYMLEDDTDDIPLIEYEFGKDGKHFLTCRSELEASRYLPLMRKNLGEGNYHYIIGIGDPGFDDDSADEDDEYAFREDVVVSNYDLPVTRLDVSDIVEARGMNSVKYMDHILHIGISESLGDEQKKRMYAEYILSHPEELLRRLPKDEINLLLFLLANRSQARGVLFANDRSPLMMEIACVANMYNDGHGMNRVRVADDFQRVALTLVAGVRMSDEARRRYDVEEVIEGLANLYGEVTLEDAKRQLMMIRGGFRSEAGRLIDSVMDTSMVLDFMLRKVDDTKTGLYVIADDNIVFTSRCAWDKPEQLRHAIASHQPAIAERHPFTEEEIRAAGSGEIPVIPNARQDEFWDFLTDELKLYDHHARQICFNLWYKANHAEEPGYDDMTADEYFEQEALFMDDLDDSTRQKAWQMLHGYMDHMPRWTLKGYAPADVIGTGA